MGTSADRRDPLGVPLSGSHIGALDGIRGIAILLVLVFHYGRNARGFGMSHPLLSASELGWCGVDLFFVLSGFLITGILYDSRAKPNYFRNFYARRMLRIFPLYYTAILVVVVLGVVWPEAGIWGTYSPAWIALYLTNFLIAFEGAEAAGVLTHFWSLAVEEHFYLVWPLLVLLGTRRTLMAVAAGVIVVAFAIRTVFFLNGAGYDTLFFPTPMRMDALAVGALVALAARGPAGIAGLRKLAWAAVLVSGAAVAAILLGTWGALGAWSFRADNPMLMWIGYTILAVGFGGALVIGVSWSPASVVLNTPVLRWFGRYSYGMYVWHVIVNVIVFATASAATLQAWGAAYILLAFVLMTLVSLTSYHVLEQPFLRLKKHFETDSPHAGAAALPATSTANLHGVSGGSTNPAR
jgi:peptidoglycan/LPS O-acetylase OafA/YrhL